MWIPITLAAATFQILRTSRQHELRTLLGTNAAGFVRYAYGLPLALLLSLVLFGAAGRELPQIPGRFWWTVAAAGLVNTSQREAINVAGSLWSDLATSLSGVDLRVEGEEHLWSHRPAVFIFNHQSGLHAILMLKLIRRDLTGVGKKEIKSNPVFGPLFSAAGAVFIDRSDTKGAIAALEPAVTALREGRSLLIAPEGTRSRTPRLGR